MRLTNVLGLPQPLMRAVANDEYTRDGADLTVTEVVAPPRLVTLRREHEDELVEDVSERIWSLFGQLVHELLRRADLDALTEMRLAMTVRGWKVSGAFDRLALFPDGLLSDWKYTSAWSVIPRGSDGTVGVKPEWEAQLNLYRLLVESHGGDVDRAEIVAVLRDWSRGRALASPTYPQHGVVVLPVALWDRERAWRYLEERVALHQAARTGTVPDCTPEEQWRRADAWAHMRDGRKSAMRLYATETEAAAAVAADVPKKGRAYVQHRPGMAVRCAEYCPVRAVCPQRLREGTPLGGATADTDTDEAAA